jgi:hypothetical protein
LRRWLPGGTGTRQGFRAITTKQEAGNEGAERSPTASKGGEAMKYRTLGRTGIDDGDVPLDDERQTGL